MTPLGGTSWFHRQSWSGEPSDVADARAFVALHLQEYGLDELRDDLRLVVSELTTNVIRHAAGPFSVVLRRDGGKIELGVSDGSEEAPVELLVDGGSMHGRGIRLVSAHSLDWGVRWASGGGKSVWASFEMPESARGVGR